MILNNVLAMKKFFSLFALVAVAAMTLSSCAKEIVNEDVVDNGVKMKTITVKTSIETKTSLDANHENIVWTNGDKISIFNDVDYTNLEVAYVAGGDITIEVPEATTEIYAHYPYFGGNENGPTDVSLYITNSQKQTNPGELNGYNFPMVAKGTVSADNKALISLYPVASALALNLYHTGLEGTETVSSVTVTPDNSNTLFTGSQKTNLSGDNIQYTTAANSSPVTVTLTNPLTLGSAKPTDKQKFEGQIYVCLAKQSYANVTFEIVTNKGTYTITSGDTPFDCINNDFVPVNINLKKAEFVADQPATDFEWNLVTSADQIVPGAEIVIAASDADYAMSQTQNSNNRAVESIAKNGNKITWAEDTPVQVFEIVAGSATNTVAFKCANGAQKDKYIYAASSSSNHLKSQNAVDGNASWTVSIDASSSCVLTANGSNTRNVLRFNLNTSGNAPLFSCYANSSTTGTPLALYIKGAAADPNAKAIISNGTLEVAATGTAANYEQAYTLVNINEDTETINLTSSDIIIEPLALGGDVTFSMAPNYSSSKVTGSITLTLASDENVTATIPVEQKGSTLTTSASEIIIPSDQNTASFTVTSAEFGYDAIVYSVESGMNLTIASGATGSANASAQTVTVSSTIEAPTSGDPIVLGTVKVYRNENNADPQLKEIVVKKAVHTDVNESWVLVTDVSSLQAGDEIIIADLAAEYAIGPQASNNRTAKSVTASEDLSTLISVDQGVVVISLEGSSNNWMFNTGSDKYLYAASNSSNHLKEAVASTAGDNGKWTITISSTTGTATIRANGSNARNTMRFNPNNGSPIFACYASSSSTGTLTAIYKKVTE